MTNEEIRFAIEYLNEIMPEWDYEANIYCAEACYGLGKLICAEPEGYVFKTAIEALEKAEKYHWHDLRKDPNDLPPDYYTVEICIKGFEGYAAGISLAMHNTKSKIWGTESWQYKDCEVIAWRYREPFEVKE